ncbi:MAG: radical SAM protein [Deltaproteobacteria bacterium]|nr:radical SAM protein [Deltaproteobacteria bacterium]
MPLKVNEIFYSIQGESSYAGRPCVFVRLTGCNLRCSYCDTRYAYYEGIDLEPDDILKQIENYDCTLVEITGGEPLIQEGTPYLTDLLLQKGYTVLMETNGSQDISKIPVECIRIMDIKCPSSGEEKKNDLGNLGRMTFRDELKFVIANRDDYGYAKSIMHIMDSEFIKTGLIHFSPVFGKMDVISLAEWILEDHLNVRLHLQLHKLIWGQEQRGV